jgi:mRNA interferase YafQ
VTTGTVPEKYRPHILSGKFAGIRECHIKPDWLLLWIKDKYKITIALIGTGTHSDSF